MSNDIENSVVIAFYRDGEFRIAVTPPTNSEDSRHVVVGKKAEYYTRDDLTAIGKKLGIDVGSAVNKMAMISQLEARMQELGMLH